MLTQNIKNYIKILLKKDTVDTITKKDIFIGILTSPMILLVIATFIYLAKIIEYSISNVINVNSPLSLYLTIPILMFMVIFSIYAYFIYKDKTFYLSFTGSIIMPVLSLIMLISLSSFILTSTNLKIICISIGVFNIYVAFMSFFSAKKAAFQLKDLNIIKKFKLAFIDFNNFNKVVIFINKYNIFYYTEYVKINGYKLSYADITILENQFNKKVYDFNKEELDVVTMYALN